jgi:hypothetical protein
MPRSQGSVAAALIGILTFSRFVFGAHGRSIGLTASGFECKSTRKKRKVCTVSRDAQFKGPFEEGIVNESRFGGVLVF